MLKKSRKEYKKEYNLKNKEKISEYTKEYNFKNKERIKERKKEYNLKNREHKKEWQKEWNLKNKEYIKEYKKEYNLKNKEHLKKIKKEWHLKNPREIPQDQKEYLSRPEAKELRRNRMRNKYKTDINFRLTDLCRNRVRKALKGFSKSAATMKLIGCTVEELRQHIESKFEPWMNWENQGLGGWDIEHIKACFHFNMADPKQQRTCFNWSNLQPMEHIENIKKGTR